MNRVVITGIGIISCLGRGQSEILDALLNARSGLELNQEYKDNGMRCHVSWNNQVFEKFCGFSI